METPHFVVGLTGGIATGKSAVSDALGQLGAAIVDTDVIAREVVAPGSEGLAAVVAHFGDTILDRHGALDRAALRQRIFADATDRHALEAITHPRIGARASALLAQADGDYRVLVVPLLNRSRLRNQVQRVLTIDCPPELQMRRVLARDSGTVATAAAVLAAQADRETRRAMANDILSNTGSLADLRRKVERLHRLYQHLSVKFGS